MTQLGRVPKVMWAVVAVAVLVSAGVVAVGVGEFDIGKRILGERVSGGGGGAAAGQSIAAGGAPVGDPPKVDPAELDLAVAEAVREATAAVLAQPKSADAWGHLGMTLMAHDLDDHSATCFTRAEQLAPNKPDWPYLHGRVILNTRPQDAVELFIRADRRAAADDHIPRLALAEVLLQLDRFDEAERYLAPLVARDPKNPRAQLDFARLKLRKGQLDECVGHLEIAQRDARTEHPARLLLAEVYRRQGKPELAEAQLRLAAEASSSPWFDPYTRRVEGLRTGCKEQIKRADRLHLEGRIAESNNLLRRVVIQYPDNETAKLRLARGLVQVRQLADAKFVLRQALELSPESAEAHYRMGLALFSEKNHREAAVWFAKAAKVKRDYALAHFYLGRCRKELGDAAGAVEALRTAVLCEPNNFDNRMTLGDYLLAIGREPEAREHFQQAVHLRPANSLAKQRLAELAEPMQKTQAGPKQGP